jgi:hypothetical protein
MRLALPAEEVGLLANERSEVEALQREDVAALREHLRVVELVDQAREPPHLAVDDAEVALALGGLELPLEQKLGEPEHARQRGTQVV